MCGRRQTGVRRAALRSESAVTADCRTNKHPAADRARVGLVLRPRILAGVPNYQILDIYILTENHPITAIPQQALLGHSLRGQSEPIVPAAFPKDFPKTYPTRLYLEDGHPTHIVGALKRLLCEVARLARFGTPRRAASITSRSDDSLHPRTLFLFPSRATEIHSNRDPVRPLLINH